jgi:hypothetical protein
MKFLIPILFYATLVSCGKKELPPSIEEPVIFYCKYFVNGQPFTIEAGKNNMYMHTFITNITTKQLVKWSGSFADTSLGINPILTFEFVAKENQLIDTYFTDVLFYPSLFDPNLIVEKRCDISLKYNGSVYTSSKNDASFDPLQKSNFKRLTHSTFGLNKNNEKTQLIEGLVDTYLYNKSNSNDSIKLVSNSLVLSIAYP